MTQSSPAPLSEKARRAPRRHGEHRQSAQVRERILNATLEVARESGYQGLTIARVSAASGFPTGSVYWHFTNKDGLLCAALDLSFQRQRDALTAFAPRPGESAHDYVDRSFDGIRDSRTPWEFWRIGATLAADETAPEKQTLERFKQLRHEARGLYAGWWRSVLPSHGSTAAGHTAEDFADLMLLIHDGFDLALAAGDSSGRQIDVLAAALHAMVNAAELAADTSRSA